MAVVETDSVVFHSSFGATLVVQAVVASVEEVASEVAALVAEVHPSVEAVQVAETYQTEVVLSVDIDKDNNK